MSNCQYPRRNTVNKVTWLPVSFTWAWLTSECLLARANGRRRRWKWRWRWGLRLLISVYCLYILLTKLSSGNLAIPAVSSSFIEINPTRGDSASMGSTRLAVTSIGRFTTVPSSCSLFLFLPCSIPLSLTASGCCEWRFRLTTSPCCTYHLVILADYGRIYGVFSRETDRKSRYFVHSVSTRVLAVWHSS